MTVAEYVVNYLSNIGVTDSFGIPGGVILKFLEAMKNSNCKVVPHLHYHEQMAGFAACGYAQASGKLGVAYATRGPGITNMLTCIAEAYQDSLPVLFITAHKNKNTGNMRFEYNQEIDLVHSVSRFTKYSAYIESCEEVRDIFEKACLMAMHGRKGPVFLDFASDIWAKDINIDLEQKFFNNKKYSHTRTIALYLSQCIFKAKRPVILIGDGIRHADTHYKIEKTIEIMNVPVLSSRVSQDIMANSNLYFGYIGSHASRYSNFILSKADLIISIGNRLAFPVDSESYRPVIENAKIIRIDVDKNEFGRKFPDVENINLEINDFLTQIVDSDVVFNEHKEWIKICNLLKEKLNNCDRTQPVQELEKVLGNQKKYTSYVCDVGNNEFWFSRAYEFIRPSGAVYYSKSYGTLGSGLGRAIGVYYATQKDVFCIIGDQGFQYNIQELQYIAQWRLPINIILVNNQCSGMIRDHETKILKEQYIHTTSESGYKTPDFRAVVEGYGIIFETLTDYLRKKIHRQKPHVVEIEVNKDIHLTPDLPRGNPCQDMMPTLNEELYKKLNCI